jgi:anti-anti-sigma factor
MTLTTTGAEVAVLFDTTGTIGLVRPEGHLDARTAAALRDHLVDPANSVGVLRVVVDLAFTSSIDLASVGFLSEAAFHLSAQGSQLLLASPCDEVRRILRDGDTHRSLVLVHL